jgi:hypothetical protein
MKSQTSTVKELTDRFCPPLYIYIHIYMCVCIYICVPTVCMYNMCACVDLQVQLSVLMFGLDGLHTEVTTMVLL